MKYSSALVVTPDILKGFFAHKVQNPTVPNACRKIMYNYVALMQMNFEIGAGGGGFGMVMVFNSPTLGSPL